MRQVTSLARMILPLLLLLSLCACGKGQNSGEELALQIRAALLEASTLTFKSTLTADYGERVYDFTVKYEGDADSGKLEILAPKEISGLTASVTLSGATLEFDGVTLDTGAITGDGLSPAAAIPVLISQWQSGYISGCNFEKLGDEQTLAVTTDISETVNQKTWFSVKTKLPIRSELSEGGKMVVACRYNDVTIK